MRPGIAASVTQIIRNAARSGFTVNTSTSSVGAQRLNPYVPVCAPRFVIHDTARLLG